MYRIGHEYPVLCHYEEKLETIVYNKKYHPEDIWKDNFDYNLYKPYTVTTLNKYITHVYDHSHTDVENGQLESHYHIDTRWDILLTEYNLQTFLRIDKSIFNPKIVNLIFKKNNEMLITNTNLISKSKLKHNCIYKGKCPHRGFDLSNTKQIDGVITCPLHGLKFSNQTKKLIKK